MISESQIDATVNGMFDGITFSNDPVELYDPLRYMISIGGKRVRPRLCLTVYSLYADKIDDGILAPAEAIEVFHTFTLIHDDIMDRSALRRGKPTVWTKWNEDTAILSGDVMLIDAYKRIAKAPHKVLDKVMELFSRTAAQVCEGQQYDMNFEELPEVPMSDYKKMIGLKTAALMACSAEMGAIIGGASDAECEAMYRYGYGLGMAFQVADDYLDAFGDQKVFGKPIGGDIINEKKSWLTVCALEKAPDKDAMMDTFSRIATRPEEKERKISDVKTLYKQFQVDKAAREEIVRFTDKAVKEIEGIGLSEEKVERLRKFADNLIRRAR